MSEWIDVKDRLPDEQQWVLCYAGFTYVKYFESGIFYDGDTHCYCPVGKIENVTHWMRLPDKP